MTRERCVGLASVLPEHMKQNNAETFTWRLTVGGLHVVVTAVPEQP